MCLQQTITTEVYEISFCAYAESRIEVALVYELAAALLAIDSTYSSCGNLKFI